MEVEQIQEEEPHIIAMQQTEDLPEPEIIKKLKLPKEMEINGFKFKFQGCELQIGYNVKKVLDYCLKAVANKHDTVLIFTGYEGYGKTSHAAICAAYLSYKMKRKMDENVFEFLPEAVEKAVTTKAKYSITIWDEAVFGLDSTDVLTKVQKTLRKVFTVCRSRQQIVFLVIPNIWMLARYFALSRSRFLFNHTSPDGLRRGYVNIYGRKNKRVLYVYGQKTLSYSGRKGAYPIDYKDRFIDPFDSEIVKGELINQEIYEKRKQEALESLQKEKEDKKDSKLLTRYKDRIYKVSKQLKADGKSTKEIAKMMGESHKSLQDFLYHHAKTETEPQKAT